MGLKDILFGEKETEINLPSGQQEDIDKTLKHKWETVIPGMKRAAGEVEGEYERGKEGVGGAAQQKAGYAGQVGDVFGETGESALRTGITGLQNLFDPEYEKNQLKAALAPAESQYHTNIANQAAQFGGAGGLGGARQALAGQQAAGQTQAAQMMAATQAQKDISGQRLSAANQLAQLGQGNLLGGMGAMDKIGEASRAPLDFASQYAKMIYGMPEATYKPQFPGQVGTSTTETPGLVDIGKKLIGFV